MTLGILLQVSVPTESLHQMLKGLYTEMMPLLAPLMIIGRAVGSLGAIVFIGTSIWGSIARVEEVDIFPLLRPFAIGLAIAFFPGVLGVLNGITDGVAGATDGMAIQQKTEAVALQGQVDTARKKRPENADFATDDAFDKKLSETGVLDIGDKAGLYLNKAKYDITNSFREGFRNFLQLMYDAAGLIIDVIRTFYLVVLSLLGPLAFGFAIWPGFEATIPNWLSRYINAALWLPVANIYAAMMAHVQIMMLKIDLASLNGGQETPLSDYGYMLFLVIAIAGYAAVPTVANWIVAASGITEARRSIASAASAGAGVAGAALGRATGVGSAMGADAVGAGQAASAAVNTYQNTAIK